MLIRMYIFQLFVIHFRLKFYDFTTMFTDHTIWSRQTPHILSQCRQSLELSKTSIGL